MTSASARKAFVDELGSFLESSAEAFTHFVKLVGWTTDHLTKTEEPAVVCPHDPGHRMPQVALEKHMELCRWIKDSYTKKEMETAPQSSQFFYENATSVTTVIIDKSTQAKILQKAAEKVDPSIAAAPVVDKDVPQTAERSTCDLTREERLAIYEYVVEEGNKANPIDIKVEDLVYDLEFKKDSNEIPKSIQERLAAERDYRRRRQSYRAKNVHITKKSYTEIMREVIQHQMDFEQHMHGSEDASNSKADEKDEDNTKSKMGDGNEVYSYAGRNEHHANRKMYDDRREADDHTNRKMYDDRREADDHTNRKMYDDRRDADDHTNRKMYDDRRDVDDHTNRNMYDDRREMQKNRNLNYKYDDTTDDRVDDNKDNLHSKSFRNAHSTSYNRSNRSRSRSKESSYRRHDGDDDKPRKRKRSSRRSSSDEDRNIDHGRRHKKHRKHKKNNKHKHKSHRKSKSSAHSSDSSSS